MHLPPHLPAVIPPCRDSQCRSKKKSMRATERRLLALECETRRLYKPARMLRICMTYMHSHVHICTGSPSAPAGTSPRYAPCPCHATAAAQGAGVLCCVLCHSDCDAVVQVVVRLFVAPYGNAGVAVNDPEAEAANFATHPRKRVRRAPADDLLGLAREPPEMAPPGTVRCLATTDQMELQVRCAALALSACFRVHCRAAHPWRASVACLESTWRCYALVRVEAAACIQSRTFAEFCAGTVCLAG